MARSKPGESRAGGMLTLVQARWDENSPRAVRRINRSRSHRVGLVRRPPTNRRVRGEVREEALRLAADTADRAEMGVIREVHEALLLVLGPIWGRLASRVVTCGHIEVSDRHS
jgi:hypothetical protein